MAGRFTEHHALLIGVSLDHLEHLEAAIARLDTRVDELTTPFVKARKRRSSKTNRGNRWLGEILNQCAWSAAHRRDAYLAAQFWRLARRIGKKKAAVAVSHSILAICCHLLSDGCDYDDLGGDYFVTRDTDKTRQRAVAQLQALGFRVTREPTAA